VYRLYELTPDVNIVSMSAQLERVLDAAYQCFVRHGVRKTTMEDIAVAAGMSRPAVYQYVKSKDDAYRRLATRLYDAAFEQASAAAGSPGTLTQRLDRALGVRLELLARVHGESPHAAELLGEGSRIAAELDRTFSRDLAELLTRTIVSAAAEANLALGDGEAREVAELALALSRGLESDVEALREDPERLRDRLRNGIALLIAGLSAAVS
jgi:AcrR family transcriptional regulator